MSDDRHNMAVEFQQGLGRVVPDAATTDALADPDLRARVVLVVVEEALELAESLGVRIFHTPTGSVLGPHSLRARTCHGSFDITAAAHECGDVAYSNETLSAMLGVQLGEVFAELHRSNMTRILPDGTLLRHPRRNHDPRYRHPDIAGVIGSRPATEPAG